jgi:hypothetical protein
LILRRTLMGMLGEVTGTLLMELTTVIAPLLNWSDVQKKAEIDSVAQLLHDKHGIPSEKLQYSVNGST